MNLEERKKAFIALGVVLKKELNALVTGAGTDDFSSALRKAEQKNQWFTPSSIRMSFEAILTWLQQEKLDQWLMPYAAMIEQQTKARSIGVIMAGNIPMVGFHDLFCVLISGNRIQAKCATDDSELIPAVCNLLLTIEPRFNDFIQFVSRLEKPDAVIATGGSNSARYFEYYFSKIPHIIRKNRNAVGVLDGNELEIELKELGSDIFSYFGMGCRNVSKLYIPKSYDFSDFFKAMENYSTVMQHNKYMNNYI